MAGNNKRNGQRKLKKRPPPLNTATATGEDEAKNEEPPLTGESMFSCTDLDPDDKFHYLIAAEVRRQAHEAPADKAADPTSRDGFTKYPQIFKNKEDLKDLQSKPERKEYPLVLGRGNNWDQMSKVRSGPARVVYNPDPNTRDDHDVLYHSSKIPGQNHQDIKLAQYRPSKSSSKKGLNPEADKDGTHKDDPDSEPKTDKTLEPNIDKASVSDIDKVSGPGIDRASGAGTKKDSGPWLKKAWGPKANKASKAPSSVIPSI
ncbi:hypothetical protein K445DRAFT_18178 [Daldinia sp. EC12]|nr:hypothetical protein F4774DRAFT_429394 [Daldinia eschscholtzii]OTB19630.1 hypothetical protein K445DRAFT_18178 [Daldinia sp. EC12]